jgi:hypothetical protein
MRFVVHEAARQSRNGVHFAIPLSSAISINDVLETQPNDAICNELIHMTVPTFNLVLLVIELSPRVKDFYAGLIYFDEVQRNTEPLFLTSAQVGKSPMSGKFAPLGPRVWFIRLPISDGLQIFSQANKGIFPLCWVHFRIMNGVRQSRTITRVKTARFRIPSGLTAFLGSKTVVLRTGFEPATSAVKGRHPNR